MQLWGQAPSCKGFKMGRRGARNLCALVTTTVVVGMLADKIDTPRRGIDIAFGTLKLHLETASNIFNRKLYLFHIFSF